MALPIISNARIIAYGAVAVLIIGLLLGIRFLRADLARAQQEVGEIRVKLDDALAANDTNVDTIGKLREANEKFAEQLVVGAMKALEAEQALKTAAAEASKLRAQAAKDQKNDRSTPDCDALLRVDLGAVCPTLRDRLFQRSENNRPH